MISACFRRTGQTPPLNDGDSNVSEQCSTKNRLDGRGGYGAVAGDEGLEILETPRIENYSQEGAAHKRSTNPLTGGIWPSAGRAEHLVAAY